MLLLEPSEGKSAGTIVPKVSKKVRKNQTAKLLIIAFLVLSIIPPAIHPARAQGANSIYPFTDFATGFGSSGGSLGLGPIGVGMDPSGNLFVGDFTTKNVYKFPPGGGVASPLTEFSTSTQLGGHNPHGLAVDKDGNIYLNLADVGQVVQLDPISGAVSRIVATGLGWASGLAIDPLTGDLFVSQSGLGNSIYEVSPSTGGMKLYATVPHADGLAFQWNGTLYAAAGGLGGIVKIPATNSPQPTPKPYSFVVSVPSIDGMAVSQKPGHDLTLFGNRNDGNITQVTFDKPQDPPGVTTIFTGGTRGDFQTVGNDGCLYATQSDRVIRVANPNGGCPFGGFHDASENLLSCLATCSSQPRIATVGSDVYAAWLNNTSGNSNILFRASYNNGTSFGPVVKITNSTNGNAANEQIAAAGSDVYLVWQQNVSLTNDHVFLRRSTNSGTSFGPVLDLSGGGPSGTSEFPEIAAGGNAVNIVWLGCTDTNCDTTGGNLIEILFRSTTSVGSVTLSTTAYGSARPQVAAVASNVYATWSDVSPGRPQTFFAVSSNGGTSFGTPVSLSNTPSGEADLDQKMITAGNNVYLAWTNHTSSSDNTMFEASTNNGASFGVALDLNKAIVTDLHPELAASGNSVYAVWSETSGVNTEVLYSASVNNGASFGSLLNLSNVPGTSNEQVISASGNNVYATWIESSTSNNGVYFVSSSDGGSTFGTPLNLINDTVSHNPVLADPTGYAFVAWEDDTTGNGDIYIVTGKPFAFDFSVANSGTIHLGQGKSGSTSINLALTSGTSQSVTLSCSGGLPSGASCAFNPISGTPSFSSILTITTQPSTPFGFFTVMVTGTAGDLGFSETHSTQVTLVVNRSSSTATVVFDASTNAAWSGAEVAGASAYDTASVTGIPGVNPSGSVTFAFYNNAGCTGSGTTQSVSLTASGSVPNSMSHGPLAAGMYSFNAAYSGDSNYGGSTSTCEPFSVGIPTTATVVYDNSTKAPWSGNEVSGASAYDTASMTGFNGVPRSGTVTYAFYANGGCIGSGTTQSECPILCLTVLWLLGCTVSMPRTVVIRTMGVRLVHVRALLSLLPRRLRRLFLMPPRTLPGLVARLLALPRMTLLP